MLFDRREPPPPANSNPRDAVEHDDVGTPAWPEPLHVEPRRERAMWSHACIAEKTTLFTARGEPCSWCGAREIR